MSSCYYCCVGGDSHLVGTVAEIDHPDDDTETAAAGGDIAADYFEPNNPWQVDYHDSGRELDPWHWDSD